MGTPITDDTIETYLASQIATTGNAVHVHGRDVAQAIDLDFPGMSDDEYRALLKRCYAATAKARTSALFSMWG